MGKARDYIPALKFGNKIYPEDLAVGNPWADYWYVDGDNGSDSANNGSAVDKPTKTIQKAVDNAAEGDVIFVRPKTPGIWDPVGYAETVIIPYTKPLLSIIGVGTGRTLGGLPHMEIATGSVAMITVRAPGCTIANLSFKGTGSSGGGILLDDDGSIKAAYGTTVENCYFYECNGSAAAATGGAIMWSADGGAWQLAVRNSYFMSNRAGIVLKGTGQSRPTDVLIEGCEFASWVSTEIDIDIDLGNGSGAQGVIIRDCNFATVDVPAYAGAGTTARYLDLTGCEGIVDNCGFACISEGASAKSFDAAGTAAFIPTGVRFSRCYGESDTVDTSGEFFR